VLSNWPCRNKGRAMPHGPSALFIQPIEPRGNVQRSIGSACRMRKLSSSQPIDSPCRKTLSRASGNVDQRPAHTALALARGFLLPNDCDQRLATLGEPCRPILSRVRCIALFCLSWTPDDRLLGKIGQQIKGCNEACMIERLLVFHDTGDLKAHDHGKKPFCFLRAMP